MAEEYMDLAKAMVEAKPLFLPDEVTSVSEVKQGAKPPSLQNLRAALENAKTTKTRNHYHEGMNMNLVIQAMSSQGYLELNHVETYNPMTGMKMSTASQDDYKRKVIYLKHAISEPPITEEDADAILGAKGWGPYNESLLDAIKELNPSPEERVNNLIMIMAFCRFETLLLRIFKESGALKELAQHLALNDNVVESLEFCVDLFSALFRVEDSAKQWGIPLDKAALCNAKQIMIERGFPEEELGNLPDPPDFPNVQRPNITVSQT